MIRIIEAYSDEFDNNVSNPSVPEYLGRISEAIRSEQGAITEYDAILQCKGVPAKVKEVIAEIQNDEKDHMVLLSDLVKEFSIDEFPDNTSELEEFDESYLREQNSAVSKIYDYMAKVGMYCSHVGKTVGKDSEDYDKYKKAYSAVTKAITEIAGILGGE